MRLLFLLIISCYSIFPVEAKGPAIEVCNNKDDDDDGVVDEGFSPIYVYQIDFDNDGYPVDDCNLANGPCQAAYCSKSFNVSGYKYYKKTDGTDVQFTEEQLDCDDADSSVNYMANEACNGEDDNCNGQNDETNEIINFYFDGDDDGYGNVSQIGYFCEGGEDEGYVLNDDDCNDTSLSIYPGAPEICGNRVDEDCDGFDKACIISESDKDGDGDSKDTDCNDADSSIFNGAIEICGDEKDNDCVDGDLACIDGEGDGGSKNQDPSSGFSGCSLHI